MQIAHSLTLALELALVLVILLIVREVIRLRRGIGHSRMALPRIDEIQEVDITSAAGYRSNQIRRVDIASSAPTNSGEPGYRSNRLDEAAPTAPRRSSQADNVEMLTDRLDKLRDEVEKFAGVDGRETAVETGNDEASAAGYRSNQAPIETETTEPEPEPAPVVEEPVVSSKPAPRVLSEAGRATYEKALHLAAGGLNAESIAREVDLTIAEVEVMLGTVPKASGQDSRRNL